MKRTVKQISAAWQEGADYSNATQRCASGGGLRSFHWLRHQGLAVTRLRFNRILTFSCYSHGMRDQKTMPPEFAAFLATALPRDGGTHTLALGERHSLSDNTEWLKEHLDSLQSDYGIQTIGLEESYWMNPFLWAYQDGTLKRALGSQEAAQNYLRAIFNIVKGAPFADLHLINLAIAAMDRGMQFVAFDTRDTMDQEREYWRDECADFSAEYSADAIKNIRHHIVDSIEKMSESDAVALRLNELDWVLGLNPAYQAKLTAMDKLVATGHEKIAQGKLTSDALNATMFTALAQPKGNRLTLSGSAHIEGVEYYHSLPEYVVHGTFSAHLFAVGQPVDQQRTHRVTQAVIATTTVKDGMDAELEDEFTFPCSSAIAGHNVHHLNLDNETVGEMWQPPQEHPRVVPLEDKFPIPKDVAPDAIDDHRKKHINPLLMPDIKRDVDALKTKMHGPEEKGR